MKVSIGPYTDSENGDWIPREKDVQIDDWDVWNLDGTLTLIILPALKKLHAKKNGSPMVDNEDLPPELRHDNFTRNETMQYDLFADKEYDEQVWSSYETKWDWVMGEMIWAFTQILDNNDEEQFTTGEYDLQSVEITEGKHKGMYEMVEGPNHTAVTDYVALQLHRDRIRRGTTLFGKYFQSLWD